MEEARETRSVGNATTTATSDKDAQDERLLFNQIVKLYMKKVDTKLEMLEEWESSILNARKEIE